MTVLARVLQAVRPVGRYLAVQTDHLHGRRRVIAYVANPIAPPPAPA
jgi:hypothetical protein